MAGELPRVDTSVTTDRVATDAYVISVAGELDLYSTPRLVAELEAVMPYGPEVVLDLSGVSFVDSTALGAILLGARRLRQMDGGMALVSASPTTTRLLEMVGVNRVVPVYDTSASALPGL